MIYILAAILIFGVLIAVHELGHFLAAKACGVRVNEFAIGMGPAIWKKQKGETLYAVRCLPIGGFCGGDQHRDGAVPVPSACPLKVRCKSRTRLQETVKLVDIQAKAMCREHPTGTRLAAIAPSL